MQYSIIFRTPLFGYGFIPTAENVASIFQKLPIGWSKLFAKYFYLVGSQEWSEIFLQKLSQIGWHFKEASVNWFIEKEKID